MSPNTKKPRVLFYFPLHLQYGGGSQEWLYKVVSTLSDSLDVSITYTSAGAPYRWSQVAVKKMFKNVVHEEVKILNFANILFFPKLSAVKRLFVLCRHVDIVYHSHSFFLHDILIFIIAKLTKVKVIYGFHASINHGSIFRRLYIKFISSKFIKEVDACHVINSRDFNTISQLNELCYKIPNFLLNSQLPKNNTGEIRGNIIFVGRLESQKGIDILCKALFMWLASGKTLGFNFFGSGSLVSIINKLEKKYPHNIKYDGYEKSKRKMYSGRSFLIVPSRYEPFGLVILEAMSHGVPVIASRVDGPSDIITHSKNGYFLDALNESSITKVLDNVSNLSKSKYDALSRNARKTITQLYGEQKFKHDFMKMISNVL